MARDSRIHAIFGSSTAIPGLALFLRSSMIAVSFNGGATTTAVHRLIFDNSRFE